MAEPQARGRSGAGCWPRVLATLAVTVVAVGFVGPGTPTAAHTPHDVVADFEFSPRYAEDGTAYTIVREYLLRSTDGGDTWARLNRGLDNKHVLSSVEVDAGDPDHLYAATRGDGVYRSTDGGSSWTKAVDGLEDHLVIASLALSPHDGDVVFAVTNEGTALVTESGGDSWRVVEGLADTHITAWSFAPDDPDAVFAGSDGAIFRSTDGGTGWAEVSTGSDDTITAVAASPTFADDGTVYIGKANEGVLRSTDGGESFAEVARGPSGLSDERIQDLLLTDAPNEDGIFVSTWEDGVFHSDDEGASWDRVSEGLTIDGQADLLDRAHFTTLSGSPPGGEGPPTMVVAGFNGLFRSTDGGESWQEMTTQDSTNIGTIALSPDYASDGTLAVATYINGAFRSDDRGETWEPVNRGLTSEVPYLRREDYFSRLTGISFSPTYATDRTMYSGSRGYFFHSDDRGATWDATIPEGIVIPDDFPPGYFITAFSPGFEEDSTIFAGTDNGLVFRADDGKTLKEVAEIGVEVVALAVSPDLESDGTLVAATADGVYLSTDRGESWEKAEGTPKGILSMSLSSAFGEDGTAFIGTKNGMLETRDGGQTWQRKTDLPFDDRAYIEAVVTSPDFGQDGTVLVSARGLGLFRSTDGGVTFSPAGEGLLEDNVVIASFYHATAEPIVFSPDFAEDRTIYGQAESTLYRSTDAGDTWEPLTLPRTTHPLTRESAPNELLLTPREGDDERSAETAGGGVTLATRTAAEHTVLVLSPKRVLAAAAVGLLAVGLFWLLKLGTRGSQKRVAVLLQVACGGLVFAVALFFFTNR